MRCYEAEQEMNSASSLLQLNPALIGKNGGGSPEMGSLGNQRSPHLPSRGRKSGWRDKIKKQEVIIYFRYEFWYYLSC